MLHQADFDMIQAMLNSKAVTLAATVADLQAGAGNATGIKLLMGSAGAADGRGGFYYWDPADSTTANDAVYLNTVTVPGVAVGRWKRINQRVTVLPQGILVANAGVKTLYATGTVAGGAGQCPLNLTTDNTATGPAIFAEIWENTSAIKVGPTASTAAVKDTLACAPLTEAANLKQTVHLATRGNESTLGSTLLALAGTVIASLRYAPDGTVLRFTISGI